MDYREENNYPKAFLATGIILAGVMMLCYFLIFTVPPKPIEGTGGILVNYGTTDKGMGDDYTSTEEPSVAPKANHIQPQKVTKVQPTEQKTATDNSDKKIVTQSNEDAPAVATSTKKSSAAVTAETKKVVAKPTVNANALYKGAASNGSGKGDGTTNTPGNQGNPNGSTLTNNYNGTGSGNGGIGLGNRTFVSKPTVTDEHRMSGKIVIDFVVDKNGNVTQAGSGRGTTIVDNALIEKCINAVRNAHISASENAPASQQGRYTFIFKLN